MDIARASCWSWLVESPCKESNRLEISVGALTFYRLGPYENWKEFVVLATGKKLHALSWDLCWCCWLPWVLVLLGTHVPFLNLHISSVRPFCHNICNEILKSYNFFNCMYSFIAMFIMFIFGIIWEVVWLVLNCNDNGKILSWLWCHLSLCFIFLQWESGLDIH